MEETKFTVFQIVRGKFDEDGRRQGKLSGGGGAADALRAITSTRWREEEGEAEKRLRSRCQATALGISPHPLLSAFPGPSDLVL